MMFSMPHPLQYLGMTNSDPVEVRTFPFGRFEIFALGGLRVGRAVYEPGWRWSSHIGSVTGASLCEVEHVGLVLAGQAAVRMADGQELVMGPDGLFTIPPGHDSWVVGDEEYVSLHLVGADEYANVGSTASGPDRC
jgi:hypothetical protein